MTHLSTNKYGAVKTLYDGIRYDSKREAAVARDIDLMRLAQKPNERVYKVERQFPVQIIVEGELICTYKPDFYITFSDGHEEIWEVKGKETDVWKLKDKLFRATWLKDHSDVIYKIIK